MTAEFPDTSLVDLEERRELARGEQDEFADMDLSEVEAERGRREDQLEQCRAQCLPAQVRVVTQPS
jgi:hypothetical protein